MTAAGTVRRRTLAGIALTLAAGAATSLALAGPAPAATTSPTTTAPTGRIVETKSTPGGVAVVFSATGLAPGTPIDAGSVHIVVGGKDLPTTVHAATSVNTGSRTAVLAIDTSGSMANDRIAAAKSAADQFLASVPADVKVGLVTFGTKAAVAVPPTTDRTAVKNAVASLKASGNTALHDAAILATSTAGTSGPRTVLLLTDGVDDGSQATLPQAAAAVKSSGVVVDAVSIGTSAQQLGALRTLTTAGRGELVSGADASGLGAAFANEAESITNQVLATAPLPAGTSGTSGNLTVDATAGGIPLTDSVYVTFAAASASATPTAAYGPKPVTASTQSAKHAGITLGLAMLLLFVGLVVLLGVGLVTASETDPAQSRVRRRLSVYTLTGRQAVKTNETTALGSSSVARSAVEFAGRVTKRTDFDSFLATQLEAAAIPLKPAEWAIIQLGITLGLGLLLLLLSGGKFLAALLGVVIGFVGTSSYLKYRERKRRNAFLSGLPDTLQLLAGSLSAGYSLPQAVDAVVRESPDPIGPEFNRALVETRLGVPLEDALEGVGTRMGSVDFAWVVMAIRIQREVGGNLAEILNTVAETLRERERLRRQVDVLSAEGRLSAWILGSLPVLFVLYLSIVRPNYLKILYTTPIGWTMIIVGLSLFTAGIFWLRRAVAVEV